MSLFIRIAVVLLLLQGCGKADDQRAEVVDLINSPAQQDALFKQLISCTSLEVSNSGLNDSTAFLILPIHASCPSCRNKTIDSIVKHENNLKTGRFIIISGKSGRKNMAGFFRERGAELPDLKDRLFIDSINNSYQLGLYENNPTIFYVYDKKVYKKITAVPQTVRLDLQEFFSGHRIKYKKQ